MIEVIDKGIIDYAEAWQEQQRLFDTLPERSDETGDRAGYLLLCEHPHVYTLGRSGAEDNLLVSDEFLRRIDATYYRTDRGGDITYHGYGQLVGYPILDLQKIGEKGIGLKTYIHSLEQAVIDTVAGWGIEAGRLDGAAGVWICDAAGERKICAIGVRASRFVTMHGFALNVTTDLNYFSYINPCGFTDKGVTSLARELAGKNRTVPDIKTVKERFTEHFMQVFDR